MMTYDNSTLYGAIYNFFRSVLPETIQADYLTLIEFLTFIISICLFYYVFRAFLKLFRVVK